MFLSKNANEESSEETVYGITPIRIKNGIDLFSDY
jgi:hypothetical protein